MSAVEDLKTGIDSQSPSVETEKELPVDKPETGNILGDSAPDTTSPSVDKSTTPETPAAPTTTPQTPAAPTTPEVQKPDTPDGGVVMPVGTSVNPQAKEVKQLDKDTDNKDLSTKLTELIKALEFDYPILRQLLP